MPDPQTPRSGGRFASRSLPGQQRHRRILYSHLLSEDENWNWQNYSRSSGNKLRERQFASMEDFPMKDTKLSAHPAQVDSSRSRSSRVEPAEQGLRTMESTGATF